jgi:hypothetical protein
MREYRWWIALGLLALVGTFAWAAVTNDDVAFSPALWSAPDSSRPTDPTLRQRMLGDLLSRYTLVGVTRDSVVALLGEPPKTNYFREWQLVYWLGPERSLISLDSEWLVLKIDATGVVTEVRTATD